MREPDQSSLGGYDGSVSARHRVSGGGVGTVTARRKPFPHPHIRTYKPRAIRSSNSWCWTSLAKRWRNKAALIRLLRASFMCHVKANFRASNPRCNNNYAISVYLLFRRYDFSRVCINVFVTPVTEIRKRRMRDKREIM